jgi:hypothetical protein
VSAMGWSILGYGAFFAGFASFMWHAGNVIHHHDTDWLDELDNREVHDANGKWS